MGEEFVIATIPMTSDSEPLVSGRQKLHSQTVGNAIG